MNRGSRTAVGSGQVGEGTNEFRVFDTRLKRAERGSLTEGEWRSVKILKNDKYEPNIYILKVSVKTSSGGGATLNGGGKISTGMAERLLVVLSPVCV